MVTLQDLDKRLTALENQVGQTNKKSGASIPVEKREATTVEISAADYIAAVDGIKDWERDMCIGIAKYKKLSVKQEAQLHRLMKEHPHDTGNADPF